MANGVVLPRANVSIPGGGAYTRVRFVSNYDGLARVFDPNGNLLAEAQGTLTQQGAKTFTFTTADGDAWSVEKAPCGCGGG